MGSSNNEVSKQQMADYLHAVKTRGNYRNPIEAWADVGAVAADTTVAATAGAVVNYLTSKSPIPAKLTELAAESYVRYNAYKYAGQTVDTGIRLYDARVSQAERQFAPKVSAALALLEIGVPAVAWSLYQHYTSEAEVLDAAMQMPEMHKLASNWSEAEQFRVLVGELTSGKEVLILRDKAIDEASRNMAVQSPDNKQKLIEIMTDAGINLKDAAPADSQSHVHFDAYKKAVDQGFYRQIQANHQFAEPLVVFWKNFKQLGYAVENSTFNMYKAQEQELAIAGHIEKTGLADYNGFLIPAWKDSTIQELNQSAGQNISGP